MDPIADLLTRIRNAQGRLKDGVDVPLSKLKLEVVRVLKRRGSSPTSNPSSPTATARDDGCSLSTTGAVIRVKRVSRPGLRVYRAYGEIEAARRIAVSIVSTNQGI